MTTEKPFALVHFNHHQLPNGELAWATPGTFARHPNYGDVLVCAAIRRQVATTHTVRVMFGEQLTTPARAALLRGSTYLNRRFDYAKAIRTIESIDAPIAAVGLGAQTEIEDPEFLDDIPEARTFVKLLTERSASISARGEFTARVLERLGATNIRLTGCPSMFYTLGPVQVTVPETLRGDGRRLGVSLHTGLHNSLFCRNAGATMRKHKRVIQFALRSAASVSLFEQGVLREHVVANEDLPITQRLEAAEGILGRFPNTERLEPIDLVNHMVSVRSVEDWLAKASALDAMIGFRFHGNMVALTQGVPCFYYVYDSRIAEFCRLYRVPYMYVEDDWRNPVTAILEHDWAETTRAIDSCFGELLAFYEENGIEHTLRAAA